MTVETPSEAVDHGQLTLEQRLREIEYAHELHVALQRQTAEAAMKVGDRFLSASIVVNGLAALGILAMLALTMVASTPMDAYVERLGNTLLWFAGGVALALVGMGWTYFANLTAAGSFEAAELHWDRPYVRDTAPSRNWRRGAMVFQFFAVLAAAGAIALFVVGTLYFRELLQDIVT